jgi:CHRD domain
VRRRRLQFAVLVAVMGLLGVAAAAVAGGGGRDVRERLTGYEETPAISTTGSGHFRARVDRNRIEYKLTYADLEDDVTQAHIHLGQEGVAGGISAFLCTNLGNGPAGTQACPGPRDGTVTGVIEPKDVVGPAGQGIKPGEYAELLRAIRAGLTYANVHSKTYTAGEIRAQIERDHH